MKCGFSYDEKMKDHYIQYADVTGEYHPECPSRIVNTFKYLSDNNILENCIFMNSRESTEEEISLIHDKDYIQKVKKGRGIDKYDVFWNSHTFKSCQLAVGSILELIDNVFNGVIDNGFALIRRIFFTI
jgi:histone deacetylase 6